MFLHCAYYRFVFVCLSFLLKEMNFYLFVVFRYYIPHHTLKSGVINFFHTLYIKSVGLIRILYRDAILMRHKMLSGWVSVQSILSKYPFIDNLENVFNVLYCISN